ncbi:TetR/AcrR family transcriptional regulator [Actinoplanes friuliensis]|uniref:TetR family transcriptional regulator n=1 Tax=Actinoplanes friuliensis DSM 7358 TaxID=1246995 RepID=U5VWC8_9ACTN|nr:TetR/AcrR family transcriptional regulator [Actinoplanes friuliensis]AGZ41159.1 TetR family transcriptional regulator [Actinoplanes friuliensis DSM 7358]
MGRWEPDTRGRLLHAALELFADQGYDATTAAQIAERAGLTKTTLFRHFADKREVLFQGQPALVAVAIAGVESAPEGATALDLLRAGLLALCEAHVPEQQEIGRQIDRLIAASPELKERAIFKRSAIAAALETTLATRLGDRRLAGVLADLGVRAYYEGFSLWSDTRRDDKLADVVADELAAYESVLPQVTGR